VCITGLTQVLDELTGDATLDKFREEYSRLFEALKKVRRPPRALGA
jgi:hypothetical protein